MTNLAVFYDVMNGLVIAGGAVDAVYLDYSTASATLTTSLLGNLGLMRRQ